jgi:alkanesulfonate monooxygenase SsuD/methylene tetrahydromethanopterin reductase-like flavin-dependent oxidoreductase (luciferase family)
VPIYLGALTSPTVELAGEVADGLMPFLWSAERIARSKAWISRGRAKIAGRAKLEITLGLPTFVGSDMAALREAARANLDLYTTFPFFQHLLRVSAFSTEAEKAEQGAAAEALSDRFLDAVCLIGSIEVCRKRLSAIRAAGLDLPENGFEPSVPRKIPASPWCRLSFVLPLRWRGIKRRRYDSLSKPYSCPPVLMVRIRFPPAKSPL